MRLALCVALGIVLAPAMGLGADPAMVLADGCTACHDADDKTADGKGPDSLSGKSAEQLKAAMNQFKAGSRPATLMDRIARGYSEDQIDSIAAFWAAHPVSGDGQ